MIAPLNRTGGIAATSTLLRNPVDQLVPLGHRLQGHPVYSLNNVQATFRPYVYKAKCGTTSNNIETAATPVI
uniref:SFRICE_022481 n=1 Tax=Spodoptera frugiperda TaxID=7108 RepID=A0A2H1VST0_SPOFR